MTRRLLAPLPLLLLLAALAQGGAKVKGERTYEPYKRIVLKAADVTSAKASFLWDVDGDCDFEEDGATLRVWAAPGRYKVRLTAIDFENKKVERASFTFTVKGGPAPPPPDPGPTPPGPDPGPKPGPAPIPVAGLRVLIVYETAETGKMPRPQRTILTDPAFHKYLDSVCTDDPQTGSKKAWWVLDADVDTSAMAKHWQDAMKRERKSLPWIIVSTGTTGYEGPLPANTDDTIALIKKYAGASKVNRDAKRSARGGK